jgi:AraC-like DNA-binding protein
MAERSGAPPVSGRHKPLPEPRQTGWPIVRASVLQPVADQLRQAGLLEKTLARHDLSLADLADPYNIIPLSRYIALFESASLLLKDPVLGLRLGARTTPEDLLGPVGMLFLLAETLQGAIEDLSRYLSIWQSETHVGVVRGVHKSEVIYQITDASIWPRRQDTEFSISALCTFIRKMLERAWRPDEIHFEHAAPRSADLVQSRFGAPVRFGQTMNRIILSTSVLDRALPPRSKGAAPFLERHLLELAGNTPGSDGSASGHAGFVIARRLGKSPVSLPKVAEAMGISARTLQRRLAAENVAFRDILRQQRQRVAEGLIATGKIPVGHIAEVVGYAESTVLSRAFKTWTGSSPRAFAQPDRARKK